VNICITVIAACLEKYRDINNTSTADLTGDGVKSVADHLAILDPWPLCGASPPI
jgi:hypothetical protein